MPDEPAVIIAHAYRPERPATKLWYMALRQSDNGYWAPVCLLRDDESAAREDGIAELRSTTWPARDYRVVAFDLPVLPSPEGFG